MSSKKRQKAEDKPVEVDIAPLIDVVFLLIVFFMSIWQAAHIEVAGELSLPRAVQANPEIQQDRDRLVVNVDKGGVYYVANERRTKAELAALLARESKNARDAEDFSTRPIFIRGDAELRFASVQDVMKMCRAARIWKLTLRTQGEAKKK